MQEDNFSHDITFISHQWLRYTMTAKQANAAIDVILVRLVSARTLQAESAFPHSPPSPIFFFLTVGFTQKYFTQSTNENIKVGNVEKGDCCKSTPLAGNCGS